MKFPDFCHDSLQAIIARATLGADSPVLGDLFGEAARLEARFPANDEGVAVRLIFERCDEGGGRLDLQIGHLDPIEDDRAFEGVSLDRVRKILDALPGQDVDVSVTGKFLLPLNDLPRRGIVAKLLGVSTEVRGAQLQLTGAEMDVQSDEF